MVGFFGLSHDLDNGYFLVLRWSRRLGGLWMGWLVMLS